MIRTERRVVGWQSCLACCHDSTKNCCLPCGTGCGTWCRAADGHHAAPEVNSLLFQLAMNMWRYHVQYQSALSERYAQLAAPGLDVVDSSNSSTTGQALNSSVPDAQGQGFAAAPAANFSTLATEALSMSARASDASASAPSRAAASSSRQVNQGSTTRPKPTLAQIFPAARMIRVPRQP